MIGLQHPLREALRKVVGEEPVSGPELDELYGRLAESYPFVSAKDPVGTVDAVASAAVGVAEGTASAVKSFVAGQVQKAKGPSGPKAGLVRSIPLGESAAKTATYGVKSAETAKKEGGKFLALAGVLRPADPALVEKKIQQVVSLALSNRVRLELGSVYANPFPKLNDFEAIGRAVLGHNTGPDQIDEVRIVAKGRDRRDVSLHAFDKAGFHVLHVGVSMKEPGVLYVDELQASHGRNCDELFMALGGGEAIGRGNAAVISAGLEALIVEGAKAGLTAIATRPGSPNVARLYEKMGFSSPGASEPWRRRIAAWIAEKLPVVSGMMNAYELYKQAKLETKGEDADTMILDLTNPEAVRQALVGFQLARARIKDVPKNVAERMKAAGDKPDRPNKKAYVKEIPEGQANTRVVRNES